MEPQNDLIISGHNVGQVVHRECIDFDDIMHCSATLSSANIHVCLTCGKPYAGGVQNSSLLNHFIETLHPVYIRMADLAFVSMPNLNVLPDYSELKDIKFSAKPYYNDDILMLMHQKMKEGIEFTPQIKLYPGFYGIGSVSSSSSFFSTIRFISCFDQIRDIFLLKQNDSTISIFNCLSKFMKRLFNPYSFKKQVSPVGLIHQITKIIGNDEFFKHDPIQHLSYFLNYFSKFEDTKIISQLAKCKLQIHEIHDEEITWRSTKKQIWFIPLDLNDSPLYRSGLEKEKIIPQTSLQELMDRFNGETITTKNLGNNHIEKCKMKLISTSQYLMFSVGRFRKSEFQTEKINMHVALPKEISGYEKFGINGQYALRALISQEGTPTNGSYVVYILNKDSQKWMKCSSSDVEETYIDNVLLTQSCIILYEKILS